MKTRTCGTCSACCRWPSVPEINKPARVPCPLLEAKGYGCKIYADRPHNCSFYQCSWLLGWGDEADQPDKCGVLIDERQLPQGKFLVAKPLKKGAEKTKKGRRAMRRISKHKKQRLILELG